MYSLSYIHTTTKITMENQKTCHRRSKKELGLKMYIYDLSLMYSVGLYLVYNSI